MIRQRILYVGIGGSGLDLGIQVDAALKREICGLDGNNLSRKGLSYSTNELPPFVQQVYIDLAAAAVSRVSKQLEGSSVRTITGIIPRINAYADVAASLRLNNMSQVKGWLPGDAGEPQVNPLSAGAGQFPTVGRAALFQSIHDQGIDSAIASNLTLAVADLSRSLGDLQTYTGNNYFESVAVYVGFSASGGTGCGLFYDVLMILINILKQQLGGTKFVIIPALLLPSTFEGVLGTVPLRRARLNAATALVDLASMIEQMMASNAANIDQGGVVYPGGQPPYVLGGTASNVQMPVSAVVSSTAGMTRDDTVRMLAGAIVTQISLSGGQDSTDGQVTNNMTFGEDVLNIVAGDYMNPRSVMPKPLMPMVSASLTVPSRKIADIVAKTLLVQSSDPQNGYFARDEESLKDLGNRVLSQSGLRQLVEGETFRGSYTIQWDAPKDIKNEADLDDKIRILKGKVDTQAIPVIRTMVKNALKGMTTFDVMEGVEKILGADPSVPIPVLAAAVQQALSRLEVAEEAFAESGSSTSSTKKRQPKKSRVSFIPGRRKLSRKEVEQRFELAKKQFEVDVQKIWMNEWASLNHQWRASVVNGQRKVAELSGLWSRLLSDAQRTAQSGVAQVLRRTEGISDFIPKRGVEEKQAIENIFNLTRESLLTERQLSRQSTFDLVQSMLGEVRGEQSALREAVGVFRKGGSQQDFDDAILERLRNDVLRVFGSTAVTSQPAFSSLASLLEEMVSPNPDRDAIDLATALGGLVPGVLIPQGDCIRATVVVTYPGNKNAEIENRLAELLFSDGSLRQLIGAGAAMTGSDIVSQLGASVKMQPIGDSDSVTVNINMVGQTLFDSPESATVLATWQEQLSDAEGEKLRWRQRLGYENLDRVLSGASRSRVLHKLLVGLWGGLIEVEEGTLDDPKVLVIYDSNRSQQKSAYPYIRLASGTNSGGWTSLLTSFEKLLIEIGHSDPGFKKEIIEQMLLFVPNELSTTVSTEVPPVIQSILRTRTAKIDQASEALAEANKYSNLAVSEFKRIQAFWSNDFVQAWKYESDALYVKSLDSLAQIS